MPSAKDIVARHVEAIGGEAAQRKMHSVRSRGTVTMVAQGISGEIDMYAARPNKSLLRVRIEGVGTFEDGFDGKIGWSLNAIEGPSLVTDRALKERADDSWFDAVLHGSDHVREITVLGRDTFDGRPAFKLKVVSVAGTEQVEYFDEERGYQIGYEASRATPLGIVPVTNVMRDYKAYGGLHMPTTLVQRTLGFEQILTVTEVEIDGVPPGTFDLPPAIKALIK